MKAFRGKVAAITGAASGIGRSLSVALAERGCHLALSDIDPSGLAATAALAKAHSVNVSTAHVDVADRDSVFAWAEATAQAHGHVNLIINNAGVGLTVNASAATPDDLAWVMNINFWGVVHGTQAFLPHLTASRDGHIVNISSVLGLIGMPGQSGYAAAKFAVRGYTETLRMELDIVGNGVSATCVHPGAVKTNVVANSRFHDSMAAVSSMTIEQQRALAEQQLNGTTPESAAIQILDAVTRNDRSVMIGRDARLIYRLARLMGSSYQALAVWQHRRAFPTR